MNNLNPFIPLNRAGVAIVDGRVSQEIIDNLKKQEVDVILTCKCDDLYEAISYHPDIVMHPINRNTIVVAPNVYDYYSDNLSQRGIKLIKGEKKLERNYPDNIAYNVARVSSYALHNFKYTDEKLKFYLRKEGLEFIDVKQGYTKCSISIVGNNALITSDTSIYKACTKLNVDVLFIRNGYIKLPGLDYGFIGGATGLISERKLLFSGNIDNHPDSKHIKFFLEKYDVLPIMLSSKEIIDIGSIIPLTYN
ncbi:DUF6873 family GME fold protein [Brassicibacter mesophilus]|uniref:DUF6873 family GME fold protein n=1 Tax=Brassicibacter mesophilus TaxID=745119 RepID=UPI003D1DC6F4